MNSGFVDDDDNGVTAPVQPTLPSPHADLAQLVGQASGPAAQVVDFVPSVSLGHELFKQTGPSLEKLQETKVRLVAALRQQGIDPTSNAGKEVLEPLDKEIATAIRVNVALEGDKPAEQYHSIPAGPKPIAAWPYLLCWGSILGLAAYSGAWAFQWGIAIAIATIVSLLMLWTED